MEDFASFADLEIEDDSAARPRKRERGPTELPRYNAVVHEHAWFMDTPTNLGSHERDRKVTKLKKDAEKLLLKVSYSYYECRTEQDFAECLELAKEVHAHVVPRKAMALVDRKTLEDIIVRCAMKAREWEFAISFAVENVR